MDTYLNKKKYAFSKTEFLKAISFILDSIFFRFDNTTNKIWYAHEITIVSYCC